MSSLMPLVNTTDPRAYAGETTRFSEGGLWNVPFVAKMLLQALDSHRSDAGLLRASRRDLSADEVRARDHHEPIRSDLPAFAFAGCNGGEVRRVLATGVDKLILRQSSTHGE